MKQIIICMALLMVQTGLHAQEFIKIDTNNWEFQARAYIIEQHQGSQAVYLQGAMKLKNTKFKNGTVEFDVFLKEDQSFPGLVYRAAGTDAEQFFLRPHLSGKPDANQAAPLVQGITPWQLMFGPKYSFSYDYNYDNWTHIKVVVQEEKAQVYLDHSSEPHHSWVTYHEPIEGDLFIRGGGAFGMHIANIKVEKDKGEIRNFNPKTRDALEGAIQNWEISDMFEEELLDDPSQVQKVIDGRIWQGNLGLDEGVAANISKIQLLYNGKPGNTCMAKVEINSNKDQVKLLEFGYSDRVVAILNGKAIYKGNNKWRSRDYRYLGTIGLFDGIYLDLKKGKNTLIMAVSEDFGGWLVTAKFKDDKGIKLLQSK